MIEKMIPELVKLEGDDVYKNWYDEQAHEVCFSRCFDCGSTLTRVISQKIIIKENKKEYWVGMEYTIVCAKCGCNIFGITDIFNEKEYQEAIDDLKEKINKEFGVELKIPKGECKCKK